MSSRVPVIPCAALGGAFSFERLQLVRSLAGRLTLEELVRTVDLRRFVHEAFPEFVALGNWMLMCLESGPGYVLLDALPLSQFEEPVRDLYLVLLASSLGDPQPTDQVEGRIVWPVTPRSALPVGYTPSFTERSGPAGFHLDSSYKCWPETNILLYCDRPDPAGGGHTSLVDGDAVLRRLSRSLEGRDAYHVLRSCCFAFSVPTAFRRIREESVREFVLAPVLSRHVRLRWRYDSLMDGFAYFGVGGDAVAAVDYLRRAIDRFEATELKLTRGQCLVTNNQRILHARSNFTSCERLLLRVRTAEAALSSREPPPGVRIVDSSQNLAGAAESVGRPCYGLADVGGAGLRTSGDRRALPC